MTPPPPPPARTRNSVEELLATELDDLQFLPSSRSPIATKNCENSNEYSINLSDFIDSNISTPISSTGTLSNISGYSDDFTLGSKVSVSAVGAGIASFNVNKKDQIETRNNYNSSNGYSNNDNRHDGRRRSSHPSNNYHKSNSKERYVFSNFRFLVKEGSVIPKSIDEPFDWLSIEMVLVPEIEHLLCPICLDIPCIPRFTRCGHIYCLPCLLQYFQTSEASPEGLGNNWRSCPICAESLHLKQLRPVKFCPATEPQEGEIFHSVLIKKSVGSLQTLKPEFPNDTLNTLSPFQRLIPVTKSFVLNQILNPELSFLRSEIKLRRGGGEDSLELSFYEAAIKFIEDVKSVRESPILSTGNNIHVHNNNTNSSNTNLSDFYHFHQSRDGLNVFLHPLCMKILRNHFESYEEIPKTLSLPIIQLEREIVTFGNRKRFKYLDHLSLGTQIILVEVDLKSIVSPEILQSYNRELSCRQGLRDRKLAIDTRELSRRYGAGAGGAGNSSSGGDRSILEEWKMMEDDYYSISQATSAMDIRVPESVKLDNLDDEESFPLPSSYNNISSNGTLKSTFKKSPAIFSTTGSSPSFSALAHSLNSPFTYSQSYSSWNNLNSLDLLQFQELSPAITEITSTATVATSDSATSTTSTNATTTTTTPSAITAINTTVANTTATSASTSKKKIVLFSNGLGNTKK